MSLRSKTLSLSVALALSLVALPLAAKDKERPIEHTGSQLMLDPTVFTVGGWLFPFKWEAASATAATDVAGYARISMDPVTAKATYPNYHYTPTVQQVPGMTSGQYIAANAFAGALGSALAMAQAERARQVQMRPITAAGGGEALLLAFAKGAREEAATRGLALDKTIWGMIPSEGAAKLQFKTTDAQYVLGVSRTGPSSITGLTQDNSRVQVVANFALYQRSEDGPKTLSALKMAYVGEPAPHKNGMVYWALNKGETIRVQAELAGRQMAAALLDRTTGYARAGVQPDAHRGEGLGVLSRDGTHAHMLTEDNIVLVLPVANAAAIAAEPTPAPASGSDSVGAPGTN